jgi:hypothetical protein
MITAAKPYVRWLDQAGARKASHAAAVYALARRRSGN